MRMAAKSRDFPIRAGLDFALAANGSLNGRHRGIANRRTMSDLGRCRTEFRFRLKASTSVQDRGIAIGRWPGGSIWVNVG